MSAVEDWHGLGERRAEQERVVRVVKRTGAPETRFEGCCDHPWTRLLAGVPTLRLDDTGGLLVIDPFRRTADPTWTESAQACDRTVYERDGYIVCWVEPAATTSPRDPSG